MVRSGVVTWAVKVTLVRGPALSAATVSAVRVGAVFSAADPVKLAPAIMLRNTHQPMARIPLPYVPHPAHAQPHIHPSDLCSLYSRALAS